MRIKKIIITGVLFLMIISLSAFELRNLVDVPTAGILQKGEASIETKLYRGDGILLGAEVGLFPRFMFGVSFGGESIVGNMKPEWHKRAEVSAKLRIFDESAKMPAIALGFDSQGHGKYDSKNERYDLKSKGLFVVTSRNFLFMGNLGVHGGLNYSLESTDDNDLNFFLGFDKALGEMITFVSEYDFALNDDANNESRNNSGYLNIGLNIRFLDSLILKVNANDLFENEKITTGADRSIIVQYNMTF